MTPIKGMPKRVEAQTKSNGAKLSTRNVHSHHSKHFLILK